MPDMKLTEPRSARSKASGKSRFTKNGLASASPYHTYTMKIASFLRFACIGSAAALAGCGSWPQAEPIAGPASTESISVTIAGGATVRDQAPSWMSAAAKTARQLLYVSDLGNFDVEVYTFPSLAHVGKLTGFDGPQGECNDANGNVWIASTRNYEIYEFAHGGKSPIVALTDPLGYPAGCAIDPTSGNLAVTDIKDFSNPASVLVYKHAHGTPAAYSNPNQVSNYFAGYNSSGDLYVSGLTVEKAYSLSVLPHGRSSMTSVAIKGGTIYFPGTVAWHGATLVLGDQKCKRRASSCLYELAVSGTTARITRRIALHKACDVAQAWVGSTKLAGGDYQYCGHGPSSADVWPYPAGGTPAKRATGLRMPVGAALSAASGP